MKTLVQSALLLALVGGLLGGGCSVLHRGQESSDAAIEVVGVEHLPEYVLGFPMHVAITVRGHPAVGHAHLLFADLVDLRDCLGVEILDARTGRSVARYDPKPILNESTGAFGEALAPGESRRMLTDVSPLLGAAVGEGEYDLRFSYVPPLGSPPPTSFSAAPVRVRFRRPSDKEAALLQAQAPDRSRFPNWATWTITRPDRAPADTPIGPDNPLRLNLLLRRLFFGPRPLAQVDPSLLDVLSGLYAPEGRALQAELLQARGDQSGYQRYRAAIRQDSPGLAWWVRMLDADGAYLKTFRREP